MTYRRNLDVNYIINEYLAGRSVKSIATELNVARHVIGLRLKDSGIALRNRSEAMFTRMANTTPEERQRLSQSAHNAKRGKPNTSEMLHKRALAHKRFIGAFENEFLTFLTKNGIPVVFQEPFMSYNLDIGCGNVAVEIHTQCANPLTSNYIKKVMDCVNAGKNMIYVWIPPRQMIVTDECYANVVSLVKEIRTNPPTRSKYWVIRGTGELYATGSFDSN